MHPILDWVLIWNAVLEPNTVTSSREDSSTRVCQISSALLLTEASGNLSASSPESSISQKKAYWFYFVEPDAHNPPLSSLRSIPISSKAQCQRIWASPTPLNFSSTILVVLNLQEFLSLLYSMVRIPWNLRPRILTTLLPFSLPPAWTTPIGQTPFHKRNDGYFWTPRSYRLVSVQFSVLENSWWGILWKVLSNTRDSGLCRIGWKSRQGGLGGVNSLSAKANWPLRQSKATPLDSYEL